MRNDSIEDVMEDGAGVDGARPRRRAVEFVIRGLEGHEVAEVATIRGGLVGGGLELEEDEIEAVREADIEPGVASPLDAISESWWQSDVPLVCRTSVHPVRWQAKVARYLGDGGCKCAGERVGRSEERGCVAIRRAECDHVHISRRPIDHAMQEQGSAPDEDDANALAVGVEEFADGLECTVYVAVSQHALDRVGVEPPR
ncbi:MAG: hypothetical protein MUF00_00470 [Gemmatimonadaceae bacterium]|nr:hypothetical protein [Gemmatimonadaceae bacterium]